MQESLLASQEAAEAAAGAARRGGGAAPGTPLAATGGGERAASERAIQATFAHAAQYIVLAYAMHPGKQVYADSLAAVQRLLPLPHLRSGPLLAVRPGTEGTPREEWVSCWFGVDSERMAAVRPPAGVAAAAAASAASHAASGGGSTGGAAQLAAAPLAIALELADVADARLAADPSLPAGAALWVSLHSKPRWEGRLAPHGCCLPGLLGRFLVGGRLAGAGFLHQHDFRAEMVGAVQPARGGDGMHAARCHMLCKPWAAHAALAASRAELPVCRVRPPDCNGPSAACLPACLQWCLLCGI